MIGGLFVGCQNSNADKSPTESVGTIKSAEITKAKELGILPVEWEADFSKEADFDTFYQMMTEFITLCDENALDGWNKKIDRDAFPERSMYRDDALILLLMAAEELEYTVNNATEYVFCTQHSVDYDAMLRQFSWSYAYCDINREVDLYASAEMKDETFFRVPNAATRWLQRRMDISQGKHFLDCDEELNFHLDEVLTREDAVLAVVRLYNSEFAEYDATENVREKSEAELAMLQQAEEMKLAIRDSMDEMPCSGTAYYVSNDGNDQNDGRSPETAWATLDKVNEAKLQRGDGVYFERGDLWRGQLWAQEGVIYSAYGDGEKPRIYASPENGANPEKWSLLEGTDNIWVYYKDMLDCGALVFNNDKSFATKIAPRYINGYLSTLEEGKFFDVKKELNRDLTFFSEANSILYDGMPFHPQVGDVCDRGVWGDVVGTLYLRCDEGNPGEMFDSIEFMVRENIVLPADDAVFHNLCLKYTGFHGIGGPGDFDVAFCEIGWCGGSPQCYDENGYPICGGNAVECGGNTEHYSVTDCYIYQCYDTGVSHQYGGGVVMKNILYARNVIEYVDAGLEVFFDENTSRMENVLVEDNYFMYCGYGWYRGILGKNNSYGCCYQGHEYLNIAENFRMENNVFYLSTGPLIATQTQEQYLPVFSGNTYLQNPNGILAKWPDPETGKPTYYTFNENAMEYIKEILGDETGIILE